MSCTSFEIKIINFFKKYLDIIFIIAITLLGCIMRYSGRWFVSKDVGGSFIPWLETMKANGGLLGLDTPVGNYGLPFQVLLALLTYLPTPSLYSLKILFIIFDYILAIITGLVVYECLGKKRIGFILGYIAVILSPNVVLNSSVWGQCDSIYVSFLILTFYFVLKEKYIPMFIAVSIAFAFKLQAIFFLPLLLILYFATKKFSFLNFLILPVVLFLTSLPAFFFGRSIFSETTSIYTDQVDLFNKMYLNYPSFWVIFGNGKNGKYFEMMALALTISILGTGLYIILRTGKQQFTKKELCKLSLWICWTCVLFLPSMHDRYGYVVDILTIILAIIDIKFIWYAFIHNLLTSMSYIKHLFEYYIIDREVLAITNLVFWLLLSINLFYSIYKEKEKISS